jgi:hypothetical protein
MAYDKFKPNVMAKAIEKERERVAVFVQDCNRKYEGIVKNIGDSVTIKGAGKVQTVTTSDGKDILLSDPKPIEGTNAIMTIRHQTAFNFYVSDVNQAQGVKDALSVYQEQAARQIANEQDKLIAGMASDPLAMILNSTVPQATAANALGYIDEAVTKLYENDIPATEELILVVSPRFYQLIRQNLDSIDTDNSQLLKTGVLAMYNGVKIKMSNNVATANSGATDLMMLRTKQAIAFANPLTKIEAKRANNYIADEVRGVSLYDAKLIRPKEMVVVNVKYTA